jgi:YVTN family beta-propeller protein
VSIWRRAPFFAGTLILGVVGSACGTPQTQGSSRPPAQKPSKIIPVAAGAIAETPPQPNGTLWVLASTGASRNIQEVDVTDSKILGIVPVSSSTEDLTQLSTGVLALGLATSGTGAAELRNGSSGAVLGTVAVGAPVRALAAGTDGVTLYVLNGTSSSASVSIVDTQTDAVTATVPAPLDSIGVAVSPDQRDLFLLRSDGEVAVIQTAGGKQVSESFSVGPSPVAESVSPDGKTLYVLKQAGNGTNVAVVDISTEQVLRAQPAPAHGVDVEVSPNGQSLYLLDATAAHGNLQVFSTST